MSAAGVGPALTRPSTLRLYQIGLRRHGAPSGCRARRTDATRVGCTPVHGALSANGGPRTLTTLRPPGPKPGAYTHFRHVRICAWRYSGSNRGCRFAGPVLYQLSYIPMVRASMASIDVSHHRTHRVHRLRPRTTEVGDDAGIPGTHDGVPFAFLDGGGPEDSNLCFAAYETAVTPFTCPRRCTWI